MVGHAHRAERLRVADGLRNVLVAARLAVGNVPQGSPDLFLKGRSVQPVREIEAPARPGEIFVQLPEHLLRQPVGRAHLLYVRAGALQRRYRAVLPVHLQVAHRRVIDDRSLHGNVLPSRFAAIIAHFPAECTADRPAA